VASRDSYLVVDEAFADVNPECSVATAAGGDRYPRLVVLRSFGKFYGLAGIRLGFIIAAPTIITRVRELLGDWPISADAIAAGAAAYTDDAWADRTRERLQHAARRLDDLLISSGLDIIGGTSLFRLARSNDARARFEQLLHAGVLARPFDHDPTLLRFGLPPDASAWHRLAEALRTP
jgi:cobalamin biosynthetic protein CobC